MIEPFNRIVLRTPLLHFDTVGQITDTEELLSFCRQPFMQEALYLASPALYDELQKNRPDEKLLASLTKYLQRAATRCTPFALFASCSVATDSGQAVLPFDIKQQERHTRPDMNYLCALAQHLAAIPAIRQQLVFSPNTGMYKSGDKWRYTEYRFENTSRIHQLTDITDNGYVTEVLNAACSGASIDTLAGVIVSEEIDVAEAHDFIHELIDAQVLLSELEVPVTGPEFLHVLIEKLQAIDAPEATLACTTLQFMRDKLAEADQAERAVPVEMYREIGNRLRELGVAFDWKFLFQTDFFRHTSPLPLSRIADEVIPAVLALGKLSGNAENPSLKKFTDAFLERYEGREVSLAEALDNENGLGYPYTNERNYDLSPMLNGFEPGTEEGKTEEVNWTPVAEMLLQKLTAAQQTGENIRITDKDLAPFSFDKKKLPDTFSVMCSITSFDEQQDQMQILLGQAGGSSAVNLLGRFCHGSPDMESLVREITAYESARNPDVLLAEIVHLPEARVGNVVYRPVFRAYEIPYLAKSAVPAENQLPLNDLVLRVINGKLVLRSKKHNKMVIPRLGNAHNYSALGLPLYHFLCDLQNHYHQEGVGLDLYFFSRRFRRLPRISYRNVILAPASWRFKKSELEQLFNCPEHNLPETINAWRKTHGLPERMLLPDGDNELYINWSNLLSVKCVFDIIRKKEEVVFTEYLFNPDKALLRSGDGVYTNQVILSLRQTGEKTPLTRQTGFAPAAENRPALQRRFLPGSEWLYLKIYTGIKTADDLLTTVLNPLVQELKAEKAVSGFFFIRYYDPQSHIRFRLKLTDTTHGPRVIGRIAALLEPFSENGLISRLQFDTYERELERYGAGAIGEAETIFEADSEMSIYTISYLDGDYGDTIRWKIALLAVRAYCRAFGLSDKAVSDFTAAQAAAFQQEFSTGKAQRVQLDKMYRENRSDIEYILGGAYDPADECMPLYTLASGFEQKLGACAAAYTAVAGTAFVQYALPSFIHMCVNRFFRSKQRRHELIIYYYLNKYYSSLLARQRAGSEKKNVYV